MYYNYNPNYYYSTPPPEYKKPRRPVEHIDVIEALGYDPKRKWYPISGFRGYEISNDGYLRSMKLNKSHPHGILLKPKESKYGSKTFELTSDNGARVTMPLSKLMQMTYSDRNGGIRQTSDIIAGARNKRAFQVQTQYDSTVHEVVPELKPMFTVVPDKPEDRPASFNFTTIPDYQPQIKREIICPIYDLEEKVYYGSQRN